MRPCLPWLQEPPSLPLAEYDYRHKSKGRTWSTWSAVCSRVPRASETENLEANFLLGKARRPPAVARDRYLKWLRGVSSSSSWRPPPPHRRPVWRCARPYGLWAGTTPHRRGHSMSARTAASTTTMLRPESRAGCCPTVVLRLLLRLLLRLRRRKRRLNGRRMQLKMGRRTTSTPPQERPHGLCQTVPS